MAGIARFRAGLQTGQIKTASIVTFSHFFVGATTLLQAILLARILPVAEFGKLATMLAAAAVFETSVNARASETALAAFSTTAHGSSEQRGLLRYLLRLDLAWSATAYSIAAIALLVYDTLTGQSSTALFLLLLGGFISFPWGTAKGYITVYLSARKFVPGEIGYMVSTAGIGVGLTYLLGSVGFAIGMVLASSVKAFAGLRAIGLPLRSIFSGPREPGSFSSRSIWWLGTTGTIRSLLMNGLQQLDILLLAILSGPFAVGLYRPAKAICGVPQRLGQPIWILLKRHIIGVTSAGRGGAVSEPIILASLALLVIGVVALPALLHFSESGMALLFGPSYAAAGQLLWWLLPAAWVLYGVTGWSGTFGSISKRRLTIIAIYLGQLATILLVTALGRGTLLSVTIGVAVSQIGAAGAFWVIYLAHRRAQTTELSPRAPAAQSDPSATPDP
jgi:O-antigen/teichoic acid export membrane protein